MGFDEERGDQLHVANLRFIDSQEKALAGTNEESFFSLSRGEYFHVAELAAIIVIALLVLFVVMRPLVRRIITPERQLELADLTGPFPALTGPDSEGAGAAQGVENLPALAPPTPPNNKAIEALKSARIDGDVQASTIREVATVVEQNPEEAVGIVRQWIHQSA